MSTKAHERPRRRHHAIPLGRIITRTVEVAVCLGVIGGASYGFYSFAGESEYFRVKRVRVEGLSILSEDTVCAAAGLTDASNVLFLKAGGIRRRVEALPYVRDCKVMTVFPDTVVIRVTEREAEATLLAENKLFALDNQGRVLREMAMDETQVGPLIADVPELGPVEPGQMLTQPALHEALAVWTAFSRSATAQRLRLSELSARKENDIRMYCENVPFEIRWGRGDYTTQAQRLDALWKAKGGKLECAEYLDLRFGRDLVCR